MVYGWFAATSLRVTASGTRGWLLVAATQIRKHAKQEDNRCSHKQRQKHLVAIISARALEVFRRQPRLRRLAIRRHSDPVDRWPLRFFGESVDQRDVARIADLDARHEVSSAIGAIHVTSLTLELSSVN